MALVALTWTNGVFVAPIWTFINGAAPVVSFSNEPVFSSKSSFVIRFQTPAAGAFRRWALDFVHASFISTGRLV